MGNNIKILNGKLQKVSMNTPSLILREYEYGDEKEILRLISTNQEHLKNVLDEWELKMSIEGDAFHYIRKYKLAFKLRKIYAFAVWHKKLNKLVGQIILFNLKWSDKSAEIGSFVDSNYQGLGITTEAKTATIKYAFNILKLDSIIANCHKDNLATHRVNKKCGFCVKGEEENMLIFHMDRERYKEFNF